MFVVPTLEGGGAERVAADLLEAFSKTDVSLLLVLFNQKQGYGVPDGLKVRYLNIGEYKNLVYTVIKFFLIIFRLMKVIREEKPSNILSFLDYTNVVVLLANMLLLQKVKIAITVHIPPTLHLHTYEKGVTNRLLSMLMQLFYKKADKIITVSEFIRNDLIANFGIHQERVVTIYNPISFDEIGERICEEVEHPWFKENIPVLISAGRLTKQKGFDYLLKAFAVVKEQTNARLVILGEGEDEIVLKELSMKLGLDKDVDFLGFQKNPYKYMKRSALYVLSSLYEGHPMVLLEAMACGLPVVSTIYNPNTNEVIENGKDGLLVPIADYKALAEAIIRLLRDTSLCNALSQEAKRKVEGLSLERIVEQYKKVLFED